MIILKSVMVAFLLLIFFAALRGLIATKLVEFTKSNTPNCHKQLAWVRMAGGTFESDTAGTFQTAVDGTFVSATGGTFETAIGGTFESDTGGTFAPLLS
jgi:hypothetical protein